jgi:hypothetical protein
MQFEGALIKEQGVTFAIIVVKYYVLENPTEREEVRSGFSLIREFRGIPIILMAQDSRGVPTYHGKKDIVNFLVGIDLSRIPWKKYTIQ